MQDRRSVLRTGALAIATTVGLAGCAGDAGTEDGAGERTTAPDAAGTTAADSTGGTATDGTRTDTETPTDGSQTVAETTTDPATATATPAATVTVAPGGDLQFSPASVQVAVGETVRWTWDASGHNVVPTSIPDGASWDGSPGDDLYDDGYSFDSTFETAGTYEYKCQPHGSIGMVGSVTVE